MTNCRVVDSLRNANPDPSGCVLAFVHLGQVIKTPIKRDPPWDYGRLDIIAAIELVVCYMGACLPMLGACLVLLFPDRFGPSRTCSSSKPQSSRWTVAQGEQGTLMAKPKRVMSAQRASVRVSRSPGSSLDEVEMPMVRPKSSKWDLEMASDTQPLAAEPVHVMYQYQADTELGVSASKKYEGGRWIARDCRTVGQAQEAK